MRTSEYEANLALTPQDPPSWTKPAPIRNRAPQPVAPNRIPALLVAVVAVGAAALLVILL